jgi:hypothetical protein
MSSGTGRPGIVGVALSFRPAGLRAHRQEGQEIDLGRRRNPCAGWRCLAHRLFPRCLAPAIPDIGYFLGAWHRRSPSRLFLRAPSCVRKYGKVTALDSDGGTVLEYLQKWVEPAVLSQIVGALIGAFIAIGLWWAERHRLEREREAEEVQRNKRFRLTLRSALNRLRNELDLFILQCTTTRTEILSKESAGMDGYDGHWKSVASLFDRFPINIPNTLEFSELHILYLSDVEADQLSLTKGMIQDLFIDIRTLKQNAVESFPADSLCDALAEIEKSASAVTEKLCEFDMGLQAERGLAR